MDGRTGILSSGYHPSFSYTQQSEFILEVKDVHSMMMMMMMIKGVILRVQSHMGIHLEDIMKYGAEIQRQMSVRFCKMMSA